MDRLHQIIEDYPEDTFLVVEGFNEAIIGVDVGSLRLIYSYSGILMSLMAEGMDEIEAVEHMEFNIVGAYLGDKTPIFCNDEFRNYEDRA